MLVLYLDEDEAAMFSVDGQQGPSTAAPAVLCPVEEWPSSKANSDQAEVSAFVPVSAVVRDITPPRTVNETPSKRTDDQVRAEAVTPGRSLKSCGGYQIPKLAGKTSSPSGGGSTSRRSNVKSSVVDARKLESRDHVTGSNRSTSQRERLDLQQNKSLELSRNESGTRTRSRLESSGQVARSGRRSRSHERRTGRTSSRTRRRSRSRRRRSRSMLRLKHDSQQKRRKSPEVHRRSSVERGRTSRTKLRMAACSQSLSPARLASSGKHLTGMDSEDSMSLEALKQLREKMLQELNNEKQQEEQYEEGEITSEDEDRATSVLKKTKPPLGSLTEDVDCRKASPVDSLLNSGACGGAEEANSGSDKENKKKRKKCVREEAYSR